MPVYKYYPNAGSESSTNEDPRFTQMMEEVPTREVFVKNADDSMTGTGMLLLEDDTLLAPEGFATESGSINFGDLITLSEASGFLAIQNNLNGNRYRLVDHYVPKDAPSSKPGYVHMIEAENEFVSQGVSNTTLNANPLIFSYTTSLLSRVNSLKFKTASSMTNFRMKITATGPNVVVKYYPTKAAWVQGVGGESLVAGDNVLDFKDTPLLFEPGQNLSFEIRANSVSMLGNASGVPYMTAMVQRGQFKYLANFEEIPSLVSELPNDAGYITDSDVPTALSELTNDTGFVTASQASLSAPVQSVNGQTGNVSLTIPAAQLASDWNATSGVTHILNKPTSFTPSAHTHAISDVINLQTVLDSKTSVTQASAAAPVQSVNGQTGNVTINIPTVNYPVTSVNTKTGDVVLTNTDVGAAATVHTHAISDVTNLQTTLDSKANSSALANYVTTSSLNTTLSGYITNSSLTSTLGGYATTTALTAGLAGKFNTPSGSITQYIRGDGSLATFPTIPTVPTNVSAFTNDAGYLITVTSSQISTALGYVPYNGTTNSNGYVTQAGARTAVSLTTTGTSGAATYNSTTGVLNIPNYANSGGTVTSVTVGAGLSGGTITTTGTISMPNVGTAGTYNGNITTDAQGRVTGGTNRSFTNPTRSLNTSFQISATQDAIVSYAVDISVAALLLAGTSGRVVLEYANETGFTTGVTTVQQSMNSAGGVLNVATSTTASLTGAIPAGKFVRLRTVNITGTPTYTFQSAQEVLLG